MEILPVALTNVIFHDHANPRGNRFSAEVENSLNVKHHGHDKDSYFNQNIKILIKMTILYALKRRLKN